MLLTRCHSAHRCALTTCPTCTWRHSLHQTRRILAISPGPLYAITISDPDLSPTTIPITRIQLRNAVDHLRRRYRRWRDLSVHLWLTRTGNLNGIVSLGTLGPTEVVEKLGLRWPMTLSSISPEDLRVHVYRTLRRVWVGEGVERRYQAVALSVGPRRMRAVPECPVDWTWSGFGEPMPMLIG
jgi:hypothetical protein